MSINELITIKHYLSTKQKSTICEFQNAELLKSRIKPQAKKKHTLKLYKTQFKHRKWTKKVLEF